MLMQAKENDLGIVLLDALSFHEGWVAEERFAEKLQLSGKQVRKMLQLLEKQGFVAREHRKEKKKGDTVESVAEYEEKARTATYVCVDYPLMFDMLRLRIHLAKKHASDQIDDGNVCTPPVPLHASASEDPWVDLSVFHGPKL